MPSPAGNDDLSAALQVTRLFIEALNARDLDSLRSLVSSDVEFPTPQGSMIEGAHGLEELVAATRDADILVAREGREEVEGENVTVGVRMIVRRAHLGGTARFRVAGGEVASFQIRAHG